MTAEGQGLRGRLKGVALLVLLAAVSLLADPWAALPRLTYYFRDFSIAFYPLRLFAAQELRAGRWPAWNPFVFSGSFALPYFHVLDLLHVLRCDPVTVSFLLTLQLPIAALCAFALARELGQGRVGAFAAGAVFALGGLAQSSLNLYVLLQALAISPLIVLTLRRAALRGGRWIPLAGLASAVGLTTLAVEFVAQAVLLGAVLGLVSGVRPFRLVRLALAGALGIGLAGVAVLPLLGLLPETERAAGLSAMVSLGHATPPLALLQWLIPNLFGSLADPVQVWWGAGFFDHLPYFISSYVGPLALALAFVGFPTMARRLRVALLVLALLGLWFALGEKGGLAPLVLKVVNVVRYPSKALLLPYVAVAVWVGAGAHALSAGEGWAALRAGLARPAGPAGAGGGNRPPRPGAGRAVREPGPRGVRAHCRQSREGLPGPGCALRDRGRPRGGRGPQPRDPLPGRGRRDRRGGPRSRACPCGDEPPGGRVVLPPRSRASGREASRPRGPSRSVVSPRLEPRLRAVSGRGPSRAAPRFLLHDAPAPRSLHEPHRRRPGPRQQGPHLLHSPARGPSARRLRARPGPEPRSLDARGLCVAGVEPRSPRDARPPAAYHRAPAPASPRHPPLRGRPSGARRLGGVPGRARALPRRGRGRRPRPRVRSRARRGARGGWPRPVPLGRGGGAPRATGRGPLSGALRCQRLARRAREHRRGVASDRRRPARPAAPRRRQASGGARCREESTTWSCATTPRACVWGAWLSAFSALAVAVLLARPRLVVDEGALG